MGFIAWIIAGLIAGWATGKIMKGSGYGFFVDILLGIAGAIVGGFIARHLGLDPHGGFIYSTLVAIGGAIILVVIIRLISGSRKLPA
ncbi:MAG TPA: GlsB/YeaQ/YmgE family stress response membrane protein [Terracidiphilus sp.]|nr:GlsB/YeaQ/YmgE family stress response membrane protein [Terracidiphilus sp.]